mgnify:CR=1 FL=1
MIHIGDFMYIAKEDSTLLTYILKYIEPNRKKAKKLLSNKAILINHKNISKFDYPIKKNDTIEIKKFWDTSICEKIHIIYEDKDIIVVNKPTNLLTISTDKEKEHTLYAMVSDYLKRKNKMSKIFIIHRLDKDTSGIIIFAKSEKIKKQYQENWNSLVKYRGYTVVIEGIPKKEEETITLFLKENKLYKVYPSKEGEKAITKYKIKQSNRYYSLLDIEILTGKKNQIRATMEYIKHPIVGDKKYGSKDKSLGRLGLHAHKLIIQNPITKQNMTFECKIPTSFLKVTK